MTDRPDDHEAPLPPEWLPEPRAVANAPEWDEEVGRIVRASEPALRARRLGREERLQWAATADPPPPRAWHFLGEWLRPAAGLAMAAAIALLALGAPDDRTEGSREAAYLGLVLGGDAPNAPWTALGIEADPVLAAVVLHERLEQD